MLKQHWPLICVGAVVLCACSREPSPGTTPASAPPSGLESAAQPATAASPTPSTQSQPALETPPRSPREQGAIAGAKDLIRRFMALVRQSKDREAYALTEPHWFAESYPDFAAFEKLTDMLRKEALPCVAENAVDAATPSGGHLARGAKDVVATQFLLLSTCPPEPGRRPKKLVFVFSGKLRNWRSPPDGIGSIAWY